MKIATSRHVDPSRSTYERDGWVVAPAVLTPGESESVIAAHAQRQWPIVTDEIREWIADERWVASLEPLLGNGGRFVREQLLTKAPNADTRVPWHQDAAYVEAAAGALVTIFVALEPIDEHNGCLRMQRGSHRQGPIEHRPSGYVLEAVETPADDGVCVPLGQGDAVIFSSSLLHQSLANRTATLRRAWMLQFHIGGE